MTSENNHTFECSLTHLDGKALKKMTLSTEKVTEAAVAKVKNAKLSVDSVTQKTTKERPLAPYRTSTLQQDAALKLKWGSQKTMIVAQQLYEGKNNTGLLKNLPFPVLDSCNL